MGRYGMVKPKGEISRRALYKILQSVCNGQDGLNCTVVTNPNSYGLNTKQQKLVSFSCITDHREDRDH